MKFTCINIQGNLISEEVLTNVGEATASDQLPKNFGLEQGANLRDEIEYAWSRIKLDWKHFADRSNNLPAADPYGTTLARKWMEQFFSSIGYELDKHRTNLVGENKQEYSISNTSRNNDGMPIAIVGFKDPNHPDKNTLEIKSSGGTSRLSPHGTVQEYLNVTGHVYGFATNGFTLRLIRDSGRLVKLSYIEFDIRRLLDEDKYSEFTVLYRLIHSSRFPSKKEDASQAPIEKYYLESIETGNRIRDGLSLAVKESMVALGNGFLQHPNNETLRILLKEKKISPKQYYDQLRRLVYRLLFLMVTEERDLIYDPEDKTDETAKKKSIYLKFYSIARLRKLSQSRYLYEAQFTDIWQGLVNTFNLFEEGGNGLKIGIKPLAGDLFSDHAIADISQCTISNNLLLECLRNLNEFQDKDSKNLVPINYRSLDVEELGSVYEGLLELFPVIEHLESTNPANIRFTFHEGTERKTTGSYYTRPDLVNELIKSALIPVIEERLNEAGNDKEKKLKTLIKLKVCDAAAGSGHMMLAAARTIAWYMAVTDTGEENPPPAKYRYWLREAIQHCVYAVDMNPDAVELCKLALWLEGHNSGKPLSFLDHKIRNGNSLVGVTDLSVLKKGIPDDAFNPVSDDDKSICQSLKRANKDFNKTQQISLDFTASEVDFMEEQKAFADKFSELDNIKQDTLEELRIIAKKHNELKYNPRLQKDKNACDLYTSAFFYNYTKIDDPIAPSSQKLQTYLKSGGGVEARAIGNANVLSLEHSFFHWPLEFPDVFEQGGFDVMLGNPPWEKLQAEEEEFFKSKNDSIANDKNAERRKENIEKLKELDIDLYNEWIWFKTSILRTSKFIIGSERFPYSAKGNLNLYKVFVELVRSNISLHGRGGLVVQSGLFTDELSKELFENLIIKKNIVSVFDFENVNKIFKIDSRMRFSLLTLTKKENISKALFKFYLKLPEQIYPYSSGVLMDYDDIRLINPNTFVCPQVSSQIVFDLLKKLYKNKLVVNSELKDKSLEVGFWGEMFNMTRAQKYLNSTIEYSETKYAPLYEAKYFHHYDHRFATFEGKSPAECMKGNTDYLSDENKSTLKLPQFRYYINSAEVISKCERYNLKKNWLLCVRSITSATNERTVISAIIPKLGVGNSANIALTNEPLKAAHILGTFNTLITDFIAQAKVGNQNFNIYIIEQLPILPLDTIILDSKIIERVLELTFSSWDIKSFADDVWKEADENLRVAIKKQWEENKSATGGHEFTPPEWCEIETDGCPLPPFKWDEERRAVLKAELDAIYAKLYGLTTDELRYILDPQDVYGPDFPGETFRVLKDKEIKKFGEYRTKRLVLEAWERLNSNKS